MICSSSVSASDANDDIVAIDDEVDNFVSTSDTEIASASNTNETIISASEDSGDTLGAGTGTFTELQTLINNNYGKTINLDRNYEYDSGFNSGKLTGIEITNSITINGNGFTIDAKNSSRIFLISGEHVTIKNLNFNNGNYLSDGGAIRWNGNYGTLTNCNFTKNIVTNHADGGAIGWFARYGTITYCRFIKNDCFVPSGDGGGLAYWGSDGFIAHCYFEANKGMPAVGGGAAHVWDGTNRTILNCTFVNNFAEGNGGALMLGNGADNHVINCTFINNTATMAGGAIYSNPRASNSDIRGCIFINNKAGTDGGAILFDSINFYIDDCSFSNNHANNSGGAISSNAKNSTIDNCQFENNEAQDGANFYASSEENEIDVINCDFDLLYVSASGKSTNGGLKSDDAKDWASAYGLIKEGGRIVLVGTFTDLLNFTIQKSITLEGLNAVIDLQKKGRAFIVSADNVTITGITFKNGYIVGSGGAISWRGEYGNLINCVFDRNAVYGSSADGGAVSIQTSYNTIKNCNFTNNLAMLYGNTNTGANSGALDLYAQATYNIIEGCLFKNNTADHGGATDVYGPHNTLKNNVYIENHARYSSGAIDVSKVNTTIINCTFIRNDAQVGGALGTNEYGDNLTIRDCNFIENKATSNGGAIYFTKSNAEITGSTFENNEANNAGGAVYNIGTNTIIDDSEFNGNTAPTDASVSSTKTLTIKNSEIENQLSIITNSINWGASETITGTFSSNAPASVTVYLNGVNKGTANINNNQFQTTINGLTVGRYVVSLPHKR